jgi:phage baseplate assembly protein W
MADPRITEAAMSLPFTISEFGTVSFTTSQEKIWADRVRVAIGTGVSERVMRQDFGVNVRGALMESEETARKLIEQEVGLAFSRNLPLLSLTSVATSFNLIENSVEATITYQLPNRTTEVVVVGFAILSGSSPIEEDVA